MSEVEKAGRRGRRRQSVEEVETVDEAVEVEEEDEEEDASSRGLTPKKGRATAGRRNPEEEPVRRGPIGRITDYFAGVRSELEKVAWPTRQDVVRLTWIVIIVTVISALVLGAISFAFNTLFREGVNNPLWFAVFGAVVAVVAFIIWRSNNRKSDASDTYRSRL